MVVTIVMGWISWEWWYSGVVTVTMTTCITTNNQSFFLSNLPTLNATASSTSNSTLKLKSQPMWRFVGGWYGVWVFCFVGMVNI